MHIELQMGRIDALSCGEGIPILVMHGGSLDHRHMLDAIEPVSTAWWAGGAST